MARQSAAAQLVVLQGGLARRPEPPQDLTDAQALVWAQTVASEDASFFNTAALCELLKDYCRHKVTAVALSRQVEKFEESLAGSKTAADPETCKALDRITKMRDRETKAAADLATKLRLTNQSRYTPKAAATASKNSGQAKKPWEA